MARLKKKWVAGVLREKVHRHRGSQLPKVYHATVWEGHSTSRPGTVTVSVSADRGHTTGGALLMFEPRTSEQPQGNPITNRFPINKVVGT